MRFSSGRQLRAKVLCVALDYAKSKYVALSCDGNGDILRQPFAVDNTVESVAFLIEYSPPELKDRSSRWNANSQHGIFAGARR